MKIKHYICPRACGKTTFAENLQKEDPSLLLIQRAYTITSLKQLFDMFRGRVDSHSTYTGVIVDEFLSMASLRDYGRDEFICFLKWLGVKELILISTPDRLYDSVDDIDIEIMYKKFLLPSVESNLEIVETDFSNSKSEKELRDYKRLMPEEQYKTQILGEFLNKKHEVTNYQHSCL